MQVTSLPRKFENLFNTLNEEQLHLLSDKVWERIEFFRKARDLKELSCFSVHDRVMFSHRERVFAGTIIRLNRRSATIMTDSGRQWKVHPSFLHSIVDTETVMPLVDA